MVLNNIRGQKTVINHLFLHPRAEGNPTRVTTDNVCGDTVDFVIGPVKDVSVPLEHCDKHFCLSRPVT